MKIVGFGACMIAGFGVGEDNSFFSQLVSRLREENPGEEIESEVVSLGGFPLVKAAKYFGTKVLPLKPDVLVVQFGNVDTSVMLMNTLLGKKPAYLSDAAIHKKKHVQTEIMKNGFVQSIKDSLSGKILVMGKPFRPSIFDDFVNVSKFIISRSLRIKSYSELRLFLEEYEMQILKPAKEHGIRVVALSPFPRYDLSECRYTRIFSNALQKLCLKYDAGFVDVGKSVADMNLTEKFLSDGFHLTIDGHRRFADRLLDLFNQTTQFSASRFSKDL